MAKSTFSMMYVKGTVKVIDNNKLQLDDIRLSMEFYRELARVMKIAFTDKLRSRVRYHWSRIKELAALELADRVSADVSRARTNDQPARPRARGNNAQGKRKRLAR